MENLINKELIDSIKEKHPSICYNCINARRPASDENTKKGYVGCSEYYTISKEMDLSNNPEYPEFVQEAKEIGIGWVDLKSKLEGKKSGIITNFQLLTLEVTKCNKFKSQNKIVY